MNRADTWGSSGAMVAPCHFALATSQPPRTGTTPANTWYGSCAPCIAVRMLMSSPTHAQAVSSSVAAEHQWLALDTVHWVTIIDLPYTVVWPVRSPNPTTAFTRRLFCVNCVSAVTGFVGFVVFLFLHVAARHV